MNFPDGSSPTSSPRAVSLQAPADPARRRALRVLGLVHELHKAGYQRLRIAPGIAPSGGQWRCAITSADNVAADGWSPIDPEHCANYSAAQGEHYFGWSDAAGKNARELAHMFVQRFPAIAQRAIGPDRVYAGWYVDMQGAAESGSLPDFFRGSGLEEAASQTASPPGELSPSTPFTEESSREQDEEDFGAQLHAARTVVAAGLHLIENGYGRLMMLPYDYKGLAWRCEFHPIGFPSRGFFRYSSSQGRRYLVSHCGGAVPLDIGPERLAQAIMVGVPEDTKQQCEGAVDPAFAGWLREFKLYLDQGLIPEAFHEYSEDEGCWSLLDFGNHGATIRRLKIATPPGYVKPGHEQLWSEAFEKRSEAAWRQMSKWRTVALDLKLMEDPEVTTEIASEYLRGVNVPVTWESQEHFRTALRYAIIPCIKKMK